VANPAQADAPGDAEEAAQGSEKAVLAEILQPLCDSLESGLMLVGSDGNITTCSLAMAVLFGQSPEALVGMAAADFNALVLGLMDDPPTSLCQKGLFPIGSAVRCEEFEIVRPARTVARWVARKVHCRHYAIVAEATDITADVDLAQAYEKMALTDRLTGIANRRGIEREISHELLRLCRFQNPVSFVLFDIDRFKVINDSHGHGTGDEVLRLVARAIASSVRDTDLVARWGGEEFLVVLPETESTGARVCAEKIREKVATISQRVGFEVTISGGVYQPSPGESISDLLSRTDARLYEAKNKGRNRIC
jgi:diguanylate cyclase (GGDEF)-like protein